MKIHLDISDLISELNLPKNSADIIVSNAVESVTQEIYRNWRLEAANNLRSTRNDYINGLQIVDNSIFSKTIKLNGDLNNMVEKGISGFDMKKGFSKSSKAKYSSKKDKNGNIKLSWYLTIPFRIGAPGTIGDSSAFSGVLPKSVHETVSAKPSGKGLRKSEIPSPFDIPSSRSQFSVPETNVNFPTYKHKSSIYEGVTKKTNTSGKANQNSFVSFRRVSENSSPNSWIHSGIKAHNLLSNAISNTSVDLVTENSVDRTLKQLGYGG